MELTGCERVGDVTRVTECGNDTGEAVGVSDKYFPKPPKITYKLVTAAEIYLSSQPHTTTPHNSRRAKNTKQHPGLGIDNSELESLSNGNLGRSILLSTVDLEIVNEAFTLHGCQPPCGLGFVGKEVHDSETDDDGCDTFDEEPGKH